MTFEEHTVTEQARPRWKNPVYQAYIHAYCITMLPFIQYVKESAKLNISHADGRIGVKINTKINIDVTVVTLLICLCQFWDFGFEPPALLTSLLFFSVSGFHRNEDMKAIDVLPILKEKVAFLSGQSHH